MTKSITLKSEETNLIFSEPFFIWRLEDFFNKNTTIPKLHRQNIFYLLAIDIDKGHHNIDFHSYDSTNHSVYFIRPGQMHNHILESGTTGFLVAFIPGFCPYQKIIQLKKSFRKISQNNFYTFSKNDFNYFKSILEHVYSEFLRQEKNFDEVIRSYFNIFLTHVNRIGNSEKLIIENSIISKRLNELQELIEEDVSICKTVSYYANLMSLSAYQLNTVTKKLLDKTCSEVIIEYIVLEAKRLVMFTSKQIKEIAFDLGFKDSSYFIRFFKKHVGYTPKDFRENYT